MNKFISIQANSYIIGGTDTYEILSESSGVLSLKTPAQGTILSSSGTDPVVVSIPGNLDIGNTGISTESTLIYNCINIIK